MPGRLVLVNGPPGIGKSTLARMYVDRHPGALDLDVDLLRGLIGGGPERFEETGRLARQLALGMARTHLLAGRDVVLPQYLGSGGEIERFEAVAADAGSAFVEIVLMDTRDRSIERFDRRGDAGGGPWHDQVREIVARSGEVGHLAELYDRLVEVLRKRPGAVVLESVAGAVAETYASLASAIESAAAAPDRPPPSSATGPDPVRGRVSP